MANRVLLVFRHFGVCQSGALVWLENRIPAKVSGASRWHDQPRCAARKNNRLGPWTLRECEDALRIGGFIGIGSEQVVEPLVADRVEKPLDVRSWKTFEGIKAEACVLDHDGAVDLLGRKDALLLGDFSWITLQLRQVNLLRCKLKWKLSAEYGLNFLSQA